MFSSQHVQVQGKSQVTGLKVQSLFTLCQVKSEVINLNDSSPCHVTRVSTSGEYSYRKTEQLWFVWMSR